MQLWLNSVGPQEAKAASQQRQRGRQLHGGSQQQAGARPVRCCIPACSERQSQWVQPPVRCFTRASFSATPTTCKSTARCVTLATRYLVARPRVTPSALLGLDVRAALMAALCSCGLGCQRGKSPSLSLPPSLSLLKPCSSGSKHCQRTEAPKVKLSGMQAIMQPSCITSSCNMSLSRHAQQAVPAGGAASTKVPVCL